MEDIKLEDIDKFEDISPEDIQSFDESMVPSTTESTLRGAAEGLTLGFSGELAGAGKAAYQTAFGLEELSNILETYRRERDIEEAKIKAAQEENPWAFGIGEVVGGIAPAIGTGGASALATAGKIGLKQAVKEGALAGAKYGTTQSLGTSEADITQGEALKAGKEALIGGVSGATLGGAFPMALNVAKSTAFTIKDTAGELADKMIDAYKKTSSGRKIIGETASESIQKDLKQSAQNLLDTIKVAKEESSKKLKESLSRAERSGVIYDMTSQIDNAIARLEPLTNTGTQEAQGLAKTALNELKKTKERFIKTEQKEIPFSTKSEAVSKLEKKQREMILRAQMGEQEAIQLNKFIDKYALDKANLQEMGDAAQREIQEISAKIQQSPEEIINAIRNVQKLQYSTISSEGIAQLTTKAGVIKEKIPGKIQIDENLKQAYFRDNTGKIYSIPYEEGVRLEQVATKGAVKLSPQELSDLQMNLQKLSIAGKQKDVYGEVAPSLGELSIGMRSRLLGSLPKEQARAFTEAMSTKSDIHKINKLLGLKPQIGEEGVQSAIEKTMLKGIKEAEYSPSIQATELAQNLSKYLGRIVGPENAEKTLASLNENARDYILNQVAQKSEGAFARTAGIVTGGLGGASVKAGALAGNVARMAVTMANMPMKGLLSAADKIEPISKGVAGKIRTIANTDNDRTKKAMLYTLLQNPGTREVIQKVPELFGITNEE